VRSKDRAEYFFDHSITRSIDQSIELIDHSINHSIDRIDRSLDSIRFGFDSVVTARGKSRDDSLDRGTARARERTTIARRGTTMVGAWTW